MTEPARPHANQFVVGLRQWGRIIVIILTTIILGFLNPTSAAQFAGRLVVFGAVWLAVKNFRPKWTAGWTGVWLFITGLIAAVVGPELGAGLGVGTATIIVLPSWAMWRLYEYVVGSARKDG